MYEMQFTGSNPQSILPIRPSIYKKIARFIDFSIFSAMIQIGYPLKILLLSQGLEFFF